MIDLGSISFATVDARPPFDCGYAQLGERLGARLLGATCYELAAGQQLYPYHYHHGVEEWLIVLAGTPTLRGPDGERQLRLGDATCFPLGPEGAHTVHNRDAATARVLMLSTRADASVSVYPDSGKLGTRPVGAPADRLNFRREDAVDYWSGE
ncbi:MAG: cupin domain-containing protein [Solirubrobacteraceae bacterium]